jgi:hypothetical protein
MEAVMLVEVLDDHGRVHARHRVAGSGARCCIGRGIACDVVVDDPFVAAEHVQLELQQDGRVHVRDLGSRNGTLLDGRRVSVDAGSTVQAGELLIGHTRLRVRTGRAPLAAERPLRRDFLLRNRTLLAVAGLALCFAFAAFQQWTYAPERLAQRVLIAVLAVMVALAPWIGAWSLVSRLATGAWRVRIHLAIAACCVALWLWGYWLHSLLAFAFQWRWLAPVMVAMAGVIAFGAAWLHLRQATTFRHLAAMLLALLAPLVGGGAWWLVDLQLDPRTVNRMENGPRVFPPSLRVAPSMDLADYLNDVAKLKREANIGRQQSLLESPVLDTAE